MRVYAKTTLALGLACGFALAIAASPAEAKKKNCHYVKGNGWGATQDIAKINAKTAYDGSLATYGGKAKGAPYYECKLDFPLQACVAEQLACKK